MVDDTRWYEQIPFPALLRHARQTYGRAMRSALEDAGYDDIPANGLYIIGGLALADKGIPLRQLIRELGTTKQNAGQLVDMLVLRGYLSRIVDEEDRRQLIVALTDRGRAAADVQRKARERIDAELLSRTGDDDLRAARRTLAVLVELARDEDSHPA